MNIILEEANKELENILNQNKSYVTENDLRRMGRCKDIVIDILKTQYEAKYEPSDDSHFCGSWHFKHPRTIQKKCYTLSSIFLDVDMGENNKISKIIMSRKNDDSLLKEIMRLEFDNIYWYGTEEDKEKCLYDIERNLLIRYDNFHNLIQVYVGTERVWFITPSTYETFAE